MSVTLYPSSLSGKVSAPLSKSYAHRLLIAAALSGGELRFGDSRDAELTAKGLTALGFSAEISGDIARYGAFENKGGVALVPVGESGSTLRFLLPLAAALGRDADFIAEGRLGERPMGPLLAALSRRGAEVTPLSTRGALTHGIFDIDATVSSQFISGLLMALPLLEGDSELRLFGEMVSSPYVDITLEVMAKAGVRAERTDRGFYIPGKQKYRLRSSEVQGDFSGAAFFLAAGALGDGVSVRGLDTSSAQGDKAIVSILASAGASVAEDSGEIRVKRGVLTPFSADIGNVPDLAPILSVVAAFAPGPSELVNVRRLKDKESDRLFAIRDMLSRAGIRSEEKEERLLIFGGEPKGAAFDSFSDHRMAMAEAVLAAFAKGKSLVNDGYCVKKSYPLFWRDFEKCGGKYEMEG